MTSENLLNSFVTARRGSVATVFALSLVGIIGVAGLATDYSRAASAKSALFAASDAAALAAARTFGTVAQRDAVARQVFQANIQGIAALQGVGMTGTNVLRNGSNYGYQVRAQGDVKTTLGRILGIDELGVKTFAEAVAAIGTRTEVSLVLDTTYSMTGWKISTLKTAATRMVDELHAMNPPADYLKIGMVPFSQYVNIGLGQRNKPWLDVIPDWRQTITPPCETREVCVARERTNCRMQDVPARPYQPAIPPTPPGTCTGYNDGVPYSYSCGGSSGRDAIPARPAGTEEVCDERCTSREQRQHCPPSYVISGTWNGCVGSRANPLDTRDGDYATRIPALMQRPNQAGTYDVTCGTPMVELTSNAGTIKNTISNLTPNGETYIPSGLIWGWRMLSPREPLGAHTPSPGAPVRKFLVLMTDGLNTKSPSYPYHDGSNGSVANDRVRDLCRNIAADRDSGIVIYSVAFAVNDPTTKSLLADCARNTKGEFFDATNQAQFLDAFSRITSQIADLRLSK